MAQASGRVSLARRLGSGLGVEKATLRSDRKVPHSDQDRNGHRSTAA